MCNARIAHRLALDVKPTHTIPQSGRGVSPPLPI